MMPISQQHNHFGGGELSDGTHETGENLKIKWQCTRRDKAVFEYLSNLEVLRDFGKSPDAHSR